MLTRLLTPNSQSLIENKILTGQLPGRVAVAMVDAEAFNWSLRKNPYQFQHCNASEIALRYDDEYAPRYRLTCVWDYYRYGFSLLYMHEGCDMANSDRGANISYADNYGYTIFRFDLTPDNVDVGVMQLVCEGDLSMCVQLKLPLNAALFPQGVETITFGEFDNLVSIYRNRTPFFDYSA